MAEVPKKRFIAGAVCPACGLVDKIYILDDGESMTRRCSRCDFIETLPKGNDSDARDGEWQPVNLKDPPGE